MNENNITRFEVSNFKKFEHLAVENIGQVNLITGDNNVGKTTLLEALLCTWVNSFWIKYMHQTLDLRQIKFHLEDIHAKSPKFPAENFLRYIFNDLKKRLVCEMQWQSGKIEKLAMVYKQLGEISEEEMRYRKDRYNLSNLPDWMLFYKNGELNETQWLYLDDMDKSMGQNPYMPFVSFSNSFPENWVMMVNNLRFDEREFIIETLKSWIPDIKGFDYAQIGDLKLIRFASGKDNRYYAITTFGDGVQKIFWYLVEIIYASSIQIQAKRIMIDEIDTGVHYLKMKDVWRAIFELSKQTGVQVFATTHSQDCIKAFIEAGEENEEMKNDLRLIELEEFTTKEGITKQTASTFDFETLKYNLETESNIRGGDVWR